MTVASFFAAVAALIVQFWFFFGGGFGGGTARNRTKRRRRSAVILVSVFVYAVSFLLLRALSRYREFAADRGSADHDRAPFARSRARCSRSAGRWSG